MARYLVRLAVLAAITAVVIPAASASAGGGLLTPLIGGNCGVNLPVFAPWADATPYYFAPNGGFESGSSGWILSGGAAIVSGNESYDVHSSSDSQSALVPAGGSVSTTVCYGLVYPAVRFFVQNVGDQPATVHVRVQAHSILGVLSTLDGGSFQVSGDGWQPSPKLSTLLSALAAPLGTKSMTLQISVDSGTAQIDDLYVDPVAWLD